MEDIKEKIKKAQKDNPDLPPEFVAELVHSLEDDEPCTPYDLESDTEQDLG